jgi:hypothetical protein
VAWLVGAPAAHTTVEASEQIGLVGTGRRGGRVRRSGLSGRRAAGAARHTRPPPRRRSGRRGGGLGSSRSSSGAAADVGELGRGGGRAARADKLLVDSSILSGVPSPCCSGTRSQSSSSPALRVGDEASCSGAFFAFCLAPVGDGTFCFLSPPLCTQGKHGFAYRNCSTLLGLRSLDSTA